MNDPTVKDFILYLETLDPELYIEIFIGGDIKDFEYLNTNNTSHVEVVGNTLFIGDDK